MQYTMPPWALHSVAALPACISAMCGSMFFNTAIN